MPDALLTALVKHMLQNCPACGGTGERVVEYGVMFGKPLKYETCYTCKGLRDAYRSATDPA